MDQEKIAKFIYNLRKKNNMTQKEFADKLNVTAQAVSKWENARGIPDIEILNNMSKIFNVDIDTIIDGKRKKNKFIIFIIILILIIVILFGLVLSSKNYEFSDLKSKDSNWKVKGVAAYSKDKNSIYISNIEYLDKEYSKKKYTDVECILYENNNDRDKKISQCGDISNKNRESKSIEELLRDIEFNVDGYKSACSNLTKSNLYISINLRTSKNKIVTYKVPIKLNSKCK